MSNNRRKYHTDRAQKGFTLVELIVVLVIVAILAGIGVPAFLGYIDNAKKKELIAHGQTALSATQAALSDIYSDNDNRYTPAKREQTRIKAGAEEGTSFTVWNVTALVDTTRGENMETSAITEEIGSYTIGQAIYKENDYYVAYNGKSWEVYEGENAYETAKSEIGGVKEYTDGGRNVIYVWPYTKAKEGKLTDLAYDPNVILADTPTFDEEEDLTEYPTKYVLLKLDEARRSRFMKTTDETGNSLAEEEDSGKGEILLEYTKNSAGTIKRSCSWNLGDETHISFFEKLNEFKLGFKALDGYLFKWWADTESDKTAVTEEEILSFIFDDEINADKNSFTFQAYVIPNTKDYATLSKNDFGKFVTSTVDRMEKVPTEAYESLEDFLANMPAGATRVDDKDKLTKRQIYAWYEGTTLKWWTDAVIAYLPADCSNMLKNKTVLNTFDFSGFDLYKVTNMQSMFDGCTNLSTVDFGDDFYAAKLTNMNYMFRYVSNPKDGVLDLSGIKKVGDTVSMEGLCCNISGADYLKVKTENGKEIYNNSVTRDVSRVTKIILGDFVKTDIQNCSEMFCGCRNLVDVDLTDWNVSAIKSCKGMFAFCDAIPSVDFGDGWNLQNCESLEYMFYRCVGIQDGDCFENIKTTASLKTVKNMFCRMYNVKNLNLSGMNLSGTTDFESLFRLCKNLKTITWNEKEGENPQSITSIKQTFQFCYELETLDLHTWDVSNVATDYTGLTFGGCYKLNTLDISGWTFDNGAIPEDWFRSIHDGTWDQTKPEEIPDYPISSSADGRPYNLTTVNLTNVKFNRNTSLKKMFQNVKALKYLNLNGVEAPICTSLESAFENCGNLAVIDFSNAWFPSIKYLKNAFKGCSALTDLTLTGTKNDGETTVGKTGICSKEILDLEGVFYNCSSLTRLDLSGWNLNSTQIFADAFHSCSNLTTLIPPVWSMENATTLRWMFAGCSSLVDLPDMTAWDMKNVTSTSNMFNGCSAITALDLSGWRLLSVTDINSMFKGCSAITSLDLSGWKLLSVTKINDLVNGCTSLSSIDFSDWTVGNGCTFSSAILNNCGKGLVSFNLSGSKIEKCGSFKSFFQNQTKLETVDFSDCELIGVTSMESMFENCNMLEGFLLTKALNLENCTNMKNMFKNCKQLISVDFSNCERIGVTSTESMFENCYMLEEFLFTDDLHLEDCKTMKNMFKNCIHLTKLDADRIWTSEQLGSLESTFAGCFRLKEVNLEHFNTSGVTTMYGMFDMNAWRNNNTNAGHTAEMFATDSALKTITLGDEFTDAGFPNHQGYIYMFRDCIALERIYVKEGMSLDQSNGKDMFNNDVMLVGEDGEGVSYMDNKNNKKSENKSIYACVTNGRYALQGYFSVKPAASGE